MSFLVRAMTYRRSVSSNSLPEDLIKGESLRRIGNRYITVTLRQELDSTEFPFQTFV